MTFGYSGLGFNAADTLDWNTIATQDYGLTAPGYTFAPRRTVVVQPPAMMQHNLTPQSPRADVFAKKSSGKVDGSTILGLGTLGAALVTVLYAMKRGYPGKAANFVKGLFSKAAPKTANVAEAAKPAVDEFAKLSKNLEEKFSTFKANINDKLNGFKDHEIGGLRRSMNEKFEELKNLFKSFQKAPAANAKTSVERLALPGPTAVKQTQIVPFKAVTSAPTTASAPATAKVPTTAAEPKVKSVKPRSAYPRYAKKDNDLLTEVIKGLRAKNKNTLEYLKANGIELKFRKNTGDEKLISKLRRAVRESIKNNKLATEGGGPDLRLLLKNQYKIPNIINK